MSAGTSSARISSSITGTCRGAEEPGAAPTVLLALEREVFGAIDDPAEIARGAAEALGRALDAGRAGYGTVDAAAG